MLRVVGETAELWYDASLQRRYTLESLCQLLPAKAGVCFNFGDILTGGQGACGPLVQTGLTPPQEQRVAQYLQTGKPADPSFPAAPRLTTRNAGASIHSMTA